MMIGKTEHSKLNKPQRLKVMCMPKQRIQVGTDYSYIILRYNFSFSVCEPKGLPSSKLYRVWSPSLIHYIV